MQSSRGDPADSCEMCARRDVRSTDFTPLVIVSAWSLVRLYWLLSVFVIRSGVLLSAR